MSRVYIVNGFKGDSVMPIPVCNRPGHHVSSKMIYTEDNFFLFF